MPPTQKSAIELLENRLLMIEQKIDKLADTVIAMARAETKLVSLEEDKKFLMGKMTAFEDRFQRDEKTIEETKGKLDVLNRIFWIAVTSTIAGFIGLFFHRAS